MKRFTASLLILALAAPALAGHWVTKEVKWRISSVGSPISATAIYVRDTTYQALGGTAGGDTTADFSLDGAQVPVRGVGGGNGIAGNNIWAGTAGGIYSPDTSAVAWLLIQSDTTVATASTATAITAILDGKVGGFGPPVTLARGWVKADSSFINGAAGGSMTTGDETVGIPIHTITPYGNIFRWPLLRARISPATGMIAGARVWLRYWTDNDFEGGNR